MKRAAVALAIAGLLVLPTSPRVAHAQRPSDIRERPSDRARGDYRDGRPNVQVWLASNNVLRRGERARAYFRADDDAYVMIVRVNTDGRLRMLYPETPYDEGFVRRGSTYDVAEHGRDALAADDYPGMGYIFAIASRDPFDFDRISYDRSWDYRRIGDRIQRDPFQAMDELALRVVDRRAQYSLNYTEYYVERHYDYPRFVCYDCHTYRSYASWDPYRQICSRFRLVVYADPYDYNPYPYYRGSRVVYATPRPRYEFRRVLAGTRVTPENFIERRQRTNGDDRRRPGAPPNDAIGWGWRSDDGGPGISPRVYDADGRTARPRRGGPDDEQARGAWTGPDRSPRREPLWDQGVDTRPAPRTDPRGEPRAVPRPNARYEPPSAPRPASPSAAPRRNDGGGSRPGAPPAASAPRPGGAGMPARRPPP